MKLRVKLNFDVIEINNLTTSDIKEDFLKKIIREVLKEELEISKIQGIELSVALVGSGRMRKINKSYRGKNRTTDVLAFPESKVLLEKFRVGPAKKVQGLGEIIICPREVKKSAKRFGLAPKKELAKVLIHGLLHLLGYDHEKNEQEAKRMTAKEEHYLLNIEVL